MTKITRVNKNLKAFASNPTLAAERTTFFSSTSDDDLTANITTEFLRGWGSVATNDSPARQDFNALGFTVSQLLAYLHQMGVAEWNEFQEYYAGSITISGDMVYRSLTDSNINNTPLGDNTNWQNISGDKNSLQTTDATPTAIITNELNANSVVCIEATVTGASSDFSEGYTNYIKYTARRAGGGAIQVAAASVTPQTDSASAPTVTADVSGNNMRILCTGVAAVTWKWISEWKVKILS